jgi:hypothetical protein
MQRAPHLAPLSVNMKPSMLNLIKIDYTRIESHLAAGVKRRRILVNSARLATVVSLPMPALAAETEPADSPVPNSSPRLVLNEELALGTMRINQ